MPLRNNIVPLLLIAFALALTSCAAPPATQTATVTPTPPSLIRYSTPTFTLTPSGLPPTITPLPTATPTPVTYAVKKDDDMFGIALRFGVSLPSLKTANPKVNPYFLGVGTVLVIPVTPSPPGEVGNLTQTPTPTPGPVVLSKPICYPSAGSGLWCLVEANNNQSAGLEALGVKFRLSDPATQTIVEQTVFAPLNVFPGKSRMPIMAYFEVQGGRNFGVEAAVESVLPLADGDSRYLTVLVQDRQENLTAGTAQVTGKVSLGSSTAQAKEVWILAAAYGSNGDLVGLRRWDSPGGLKAGESLPFTINLYSLGPQIARVELFAEAHAQVAAGLPTETP